MSSAVVSTLTVWAAGQVLPLLAAAVFGLLLSAALLVWVLVLLRRSLQTSPRERGSTPLDSPAARDRLTGLLTRAEFELALDEAVLRADRSATPFCLLYLDLDNLSSVNDAFGHAVGDAVLQLAGQRLVAEDIVVAGAASRIAADEFALVVAGDAAQGLRQAQRIAAALALPFEVPGVARPREVRLSCSIGVAAYPAHGSRPRLMAHAALAMRSVKHAGGAGHAEYDPSMSEALREQADLLQDLRVAVERGQFELFYQPKVEARSLQITAAEALIRWRHPVRGIVNPALFIPLAERNGLIAAIGDWVIAEACRQAGEWRGMGLRMRVAINLSGYQMRQDHLVADIARRLEEHHIPPGRFTCEITESVAMEDTRVTTEAFEGLRRLGVHVSIDDFGTGHSSLASLRRLPAAELKIDRAFVSDLDTSRDARAIAQAIVQMAHTLGLRVVAEGVETTMQRDLLVEMGCDELQGFLFARPMTAQALTLWAGDDGADQHATFAASLFEETRPAELPDAG